MEELYADVPAVADECEMLVARRRRMTSTHTVLRASSCNVMLATSSYHATHDPQDMLLRPLKTNREAEHRVILVAKGKYNSHGSGT